MEPNFEIKRSPDGKLAIIFGKNMRRIFDEMFEEKPVDLFVAIGEQDRAIVIKIELPKRDYVS